MTEDQLFLFLVQIAVLLLAAQVGGNLAIRLGVPPVVGELVAGICLGPSLLGVVWPRGLDELFPVETLQQSLLEIIGWIGVIFLVLIAGLETRLSVIFQAGRAALGSWAGGFLVPFAAGFLLALAVPANLIGEGIDRTVFALFLATAMSISAIPVIARILMDLDLMHTRISGLIIASALADDTVGWVILAVVAGLATAEGIDSGAVAQAVLGTAAFLVLAAALGPFIVRAVIKGSRKLPIPFAPTTAILALAVAGGMITQGIGVHLVLGVFVVAIIIAHTPGKEAAAMGAVQHMGMGFFIPIFFVYTGTRVDLTTLSGSALGVGAAVLTVACASKLIGTALGARLGGVSWWEAAAMGSGRNARGAMELVIAAIGLSIGILTDATFAILVLVAVITSLMAGPMLRYCVDRLSAADEAAPAPLPGEATAGADADA